MSRLTVPKTYKLFIGGRFPRTESGRYYALKDRKDRNIANVCLASRKDFKNAVVAARAAFAPWSTLTAFNRGQILYRIAEMLEGRKAQLTGEMILSGHTPKKAERELSQSIDRLVYYAGWCDKFRQLFSTVNPVASPHFNVSVPEPMGVVSLIAPEEPALLGLISMMAPVIAGGNTCVILASGKHPLPAVTFSEVLATSDLPGGVVNILTGDSGELHEHFSAHMDVNATVYGGTDLQQAAVMEANSARNVKRFFHWDSGWTGDAHQNPYRILELQEIKTTWHPVERGGAGAGAY